MEILLDILSWPCIIVGSVLMIIGGVGLVRLPDLFTRMHAAGIIDTLAMALIMLGLMFQVFTLENSLLNFVKLVFILLFILLTSPTATHAVAKAALHGGFKPHLAPDAEKEADDPEPEAKEDAPSNT
ncbi:MAG: monovalent cation/H(+) antiporter subunit G [Pseudomonadota bacterium]